MGIGERLKEERERLGMSQTDFAAIAGASKNSQYNYEKGERSPDANYLAAAAAAGVDVLFVLTGQRLPPDPANLDKGEVEVLNFYRGVPEAERATFRRMAHAFFIATAVPPSSN